MSYLPLKDGSNWLASGIQQLELNSYFDEIVESPELVSKKATDVILKDGSRELTLCTDGGRDFLIAPLKELQPKSFSVLEKFSSNLRVGLKWFSAVPVPWAAKDNLDIRAFLTVNGRLVFVNPLRKPTVSTDFDDQVANFMPKSIVDSWLKAAGGWGIYTLPCPWSESRQLLSHPHAFWPSIENVLFSFDPQWARKGDMDHIKGKVPSVYVMNHNPHDGTPYEWCSMRCFLDTRPFGLDGRCGDQFFVLDSCTDKAVYHIKDGDARNIRLLEAAGVGEAIDAYCAHTLMRAEGRFDFTPWSRLIV